MHEGPYHSAVPASLEDYSRALDWSAVREESVELLRQYIRIPTANDPHSLNLDQALQTPWLAGREADATVWLAEKLRADGIEAELLESTPGRVNLVARLKGRGTSRSISLLSHSDVVPATRREWSSGIAPFRAEVRDGHVFGRGTLDIKGLGIIHAMALMLLRRLDVPLQRDVVLTVAADEESGRHFGSDWLVGQRRELLETDLVLGEGAYSTQGLLPGVAAVQAIAAGEKGYLELELVAEDSSHHAGLTSPTDFPARLVRCLDRLLSRQSRLRLSPLTELLLKRIAPAARGLHGLQPRHPRLLLRLLPAPIRRSAIIRAMLQDTFAITVLEAERKHNVVPGRSRAVVSIRFLPDTDADELTEAIHSAVGGPGIQVNSLTYKPANTSGCDTAHFHTLERHASASPRGAITTPILSPGASDSRCWRTRSKTCYGWVPFQVAGENLSGVMVPMRGPRYLHSIKEFAPPTRPCSSSPPVLERTAATRRRGTSEGATREGVKETPAACWT